MGNRDDGYTLKGDRNGKKTTLLLKQQKMLIKLKKQDVAAKQNLMLESSLKALLLKI